MKKIFIICGILLVTIFVSDFGFAKIPVPGRTNSWVNDYAGIIDPETKNYLENLISSIEQKTPDPVEVIIATFKSLEGWNVQQFSSEYGEKWREIKKGRRDNGVVLLITLEERSINIGVGQNLKGILTDEVVDSIIRDVISPEFGKVRYAEGIKKGAETIVDILSKAEIPQGRLFTPKNILIAFLIILIIYLIQRGEPKTKVPPLE